MSRITNEMVMAEMAEIRALLSAALPAKAPVVGLTQPGDTLGNGLPTTIARCGKRTAKGGKCENTVGCKVAHKAPKRSTRKAVTREAAFAKHAVVLAKAPKGGQAAAVGGGTLSVKAWNRTLTAKARFAGGGTYKLVLARWADAQEARKAGATPDAFLESVLAGA